MRRSDQNVAPAFTMQVRPGRNPVMVFWRDVCSGSFWFYDLLLIE